MQKYFNHSSSSLESNNDQGNQAVVSEVPVVMEVTAQTAVSISLKYIVPVMKWNIISLPLEHPERLFSPPIQEIWAPIFTYDHLNYLSVILCYIVKFSFCTVEILNSEKRDCPFLKVINHQWCELWAQSTWCRLHMLFHFFVLEHFWISPFAPTTALWTFQGDGWCKGRRSLYFQKCKIEDSHQNHPEGNGSCREAPPTHITFLI